MKCEKCLYFLYANTHYNVWPHDGADDRVCRVSLQSEHTIIDRREILISHFHIITVCVAVIFTIFIA